MTPEENLEAFMIKRLNDMFFVIFQLIEYLNGC